MSRVLDDTQKGHAQYICIIFPLFVDDSNVNFARPFGLTLVLESPLNVSRCLILPFFPSNAISRHFLLGSSIRLDRHVSSIERTKRTEKYVFLFLRQSSPFRCQFRHPSLPVLNGGYFGGVCILRYNKANKWSRNPLGREHFPGDRNYSIDSVIYIRYTRG